MQSAGPCQGMFSPFSRRGFLRSLCATLPVFSLDQLVAGLPLGVQFVNVAREAGLHANTIFGGERKNNFLLETTGCGCAFIDYDNDGWLDIFLVNGTRFESEWPTGQAPISRLYKNNRDGTFTDVTIKAGVARTGWGQGVCAGDYDNDGFDDSIRHLLGRLRIVAQQRRRHVYRCRPESRCDDESGQRPMALEHGLRLR